MPGLSKKLAYDLQREFVPVALIASRPDAPIVNYKVPQRPVIELLAHRSTLAGRFSQANYRSAEHVSIEMSCSMNENG